jgi:hypothetical protein
MDTQTENRVVAVGDTVVYHDATGKAFNAIVTAVWSLTLINLVFVSGDVTRQDSYGRQIERVTSLQHKSVQLVHGFYWRFTDEEPNEYNPPLER